MSHQGTQKLRSSLSQSIMCKTSVRFGWAVLLWASGSLAALSQTTPAPGVVVPAETVQPGAPNPAATPNIVIPAETVPPATVPPVSTPTKIAPPAIFNPVPTEPTQPFATSTILYVNPASGSDRAEAGKATATPFRTIAYALQQAAPGVTVQLAPGTYSQETGETFPIQMKPGVILRGDESGKGQSIQITGSGAYNSRTFATQLVTILSASGGEIRGVTVTNPASRGTGIWVEDTNPIIANSTLINSGREGVFVTGSSAPSITDNLFTQNGGNGISVAKAARGEIKGNIFLNTGFGLAIGGTSSPLIENNQIAQNQDGVYINDNARPILRNNVITDNLRDGVVATIGAQPDLGTEQAAGNNVIRNNKQFDLNNSTGSLTLVAIGNSIDPKRISGRVNFVASAGNVAFQDVEGHWAQPYIQALAAKGIITGFPDGTFKPTEAVTRAQFATIIAKAFAPAPRRAGDSFSDVAKSFWGYDAIQTAARGGFMAGYPGGTFSPAQKIPRVQVLVAIANGLDFGAGDVSILSRFQDAPSIPSYASPAVAAALSRRVVVNYPALGQLSPNREATRAEVAAFVYQALVNAGKAQAIPSPYIVLNP